MLKFLRLLRRAIWRAFEHDCFAIAKGAAYSSILTFFPLLLLVASVLAASGTTEEFVRGLASAVGFILPPGSRSGAMQYFEGSQQRPVRLVSSAAIITLMAASGVMISWMEGFRNAYRLPKEWGILKERAVALFLVLLAFAPMSAATLLVGFGNQIEVWMVHQSMNVLGPYILLFWSGMRWLISTLTSITVLSLIYHWGIPRTQPFYRVLPGAVLATVAWFGATVAFAWYVTGFANYTAIYGSLGAAIALLVWMYLISIVVLIGAEFNAMVYPRVALTEPAPAEMSRATPAGRRVAGQAVSQQGSRQESRQENRQENRKESAWPSSN